MERFVTDYSVKNIPTPSKHQHKIQLVAKNGESNKKMTLKCLEFIGKINSNNVESYGFKSVKCPLEIQEMTDFENDLQQMIKSVEFKQICNSFQGKLKNDTEHIKKSNKIFVFADKLRNIYEVEQEEHKKLLKENITKNYKKSNLTKLYNINKSTKKITEKLPISDRIEKMQETEAYITVKPTKKVFPTKFLAT